MQSEFNTIGKYHVVAISPINNYVQLLRTLKCLEKYYDDAYVLDFPLKTFIIEEKKAMPIEVVKVPVDEPKKKEVVVEKKVIKKTAVKIVINEDENNYMLEIALAVLLLVAFIYIIYKRRRRKIVNNDIDMDT